MRVLKANGKFEEFSEQKLLESIKRSRIPESFHQEVVEHIKKRLYEKIPTSEIYHHIREYLEKSSPQFAAKYSLKTAIMELGPTGYPFEDYVAKVVEELGYETQVRQIVQGKCISHEIDVTAQKHTVLPDKVMIEVKFHNSLGIKTDVHVPMYTKARFDDVKEKNEFTSVWLVTNTKATTEAVSYALCVDMKIISWGYPENGGLRDLVEKYQLYPVTSLTLLSNPQKQQLLNAGIVLCKDICKNEAVLSKLDLTASVSKKVLEESLFLCKIADKIKL